MYEKEMIYELSELVRLKKIELELKVIEMQGLDPELHSCLTDTMAEEYVERIKNIPSRDSK